MSIEPEENKAAEAAHPVKRLPIAKKALFSLASMLVSIILIEIVSAVSLLIFFRDEPGAKFILSKFPPQLRLEKDDAIKYVFMKTAVERMHKDYIMDTANFFKFDPVLGFREEGFIIRSGPKDANFQICALGGSTTANEMWPTYLEKYAQIENIKEKIAVINAGVPGYMSTNQRAYLIDWALGNSGVKCDAVVSMDGVNDIHFRIAAFLYAVKNGARWVPSYHAYQQKIEHEIKSLQTIPGAAAQLKFAIAAADINRWYIPAKTLPYTTRLLFNLSIAAENKNRDNKALATMARFSFNEQHELIIPPNIEDKIIQSWKDSATDLAASCNARDIPFVSYLQPVQLERYYPLQARTDPAKVNFANSVHVYIGFYLSSGFLVDSRPIYLKSEALYADLQRKFPKNFGSLIFLFHDSQQPGLYQDTVHYMPAANEIIARAVINDLVKRNILHKATPASVN